MVAIRCPPRSIRAGKEIKSGRGAGLQDVRKVQDTILGKVRLGTKVQSKHQIQRAGKLRIPREASVTCPSNGSRRAQGRQNRGKLVDVPDAWSPSLFQRLLRSS